MTYAKNQLKRLLLTDDRIKRGVEAPSEPNVEINKRFSNDMEVKVLSSETEAQELPAEKDGLELMDKEEQTTRVDLDEVPQMKYNTSLSLMQLSSSIVYLRNLTKIYITAESVPKT